MIRDKSGKPGGKILKGGLGRIVALFRNEIEFMLKDKQSLLIVFLLPIAVMIPFWTPGNGSSGSSSSISIGQADVTYFGVLNLDQSSYAKNFSLYFALAWDYGTSVTSASGNTTTLLSEINLWIKDYPNGTIPGIVPSQIMILETLTDNSTGVKDLESGAIAGYMVIPYGFGENLTKGGQASVTLVDDGTNIDESALFTANMDISIAFFKVINGMISDEIFPISYKNYHNDSPLFSAGPFIFAILIFGTGLLLSSQCIVGDEPLRRTLLTPAGKLEVLVAKCAAYTSIAAIQVQLQLLVAMIFFRMVIYGNYLWTFGIMMLMAFTGITLGMFVSVVSKTRLQANQLFLMVFILMLLALIFITQPAITNWLPMYQGVDGFNSTAYKGFSFFQHPWPFISLGTESLAFIAITIIGFHFKKTIE
jgi:ABC-2 type transport system permease protein